MPDLDTQRFAVKGVGRPWLRGAKADGNEDASFRATVGLSYPFEVQETRRREWRSFGRRSTPAPPLDPIQEVLGDVEVEELVTVLVFLTSFDA